MTKLVFFSTLVILLSLKALGQGKGIKFEQELNWQEILEKANAESKYIFVECYTTWCGPCARMERDVYPKASIGDFVNTRFISVKLQMDTSKQDNEVVKSSYSIAHQFMEKFKVVVYPSYLFFSPAGDIVHRDMGSRQENDFILIAKAAVDPRQQYYTLLKDYHDGKRNYIVMPSLVNTAKSYDQELADSLAGDYIHDYLDKLPETSICIKENLSFLSSFIDLLSSNDRIFELCLHHYAMIDSLEYVGFSNYLVDRVIKKEEINPILATVRKNGHGDPNWKKIERNIGEKYGKGVVERTTVNVKVRWYASKKDWRNYAKYIVQAVEFSHPAMMPSRYNSLLYLNNNAFEVFKYSNNKRELERALSWVNLALPMMPNPPIAVIDTKANLLYKLGHTGEGIALEEKATSLAPQDKEFQTTFEKMKKGLPTWP